MKLFESFKNITNDLQSRLFRRDVETSFYGKKEYRFPQISYIQNDSLNDFINSYPFLIYPNKDKYEEYRKLLLSLENKEALVEHADKLLENNYSFLSCDVFLGDKIKWNYDYINNYEWEKDLYWKKDFFNVSDECDVSVPWQLSRFNQGIALGKAYLAVNDVKYAEYFLYLFDSFISENPFCVGINWLNSSEVSIRLLNVLYSFGFFIKSDSIDTKVANSLMDFTLHSAVFIENNLDYSPNKGADILISYLGLMAAGLLLDNSGYGKKIFAMAKAGIEQETRKNVYVSGVYKGQSVLHSSLVLETLIYAKILASKNNHKFSKGFSSILHNMSLVFLEYLREDKSIPAFGDDYINRILPFNNSKGENDFTYLAVLGAYYLNVESLKYYAKEPNSELLFIFGIEACKKYEHISTKPITKKSTSIEPGGIYFLRNKNLDIFIKCGEIGFGAPSHNDSLSFDIFYKGKLLVTDSGTGSIYKNLVMRNNFRSVKSHNTPFIDGLDLAEVKGLFDLKEDLTKPKIIDWNTLGEEEILGVQHYAYTGSSDPAICKRCFILNKAKNTLKIKDEFFGGQKHQVNLYLHFHPSVEISKIEKNEYSAVLPGISVSINITSPSNIFKSAIMDYDYSPKYGKIEKSKSINILLQDQFPSFFITEFIFN